MKKIIAPFLVLAAILFLSSFQQKATELGKWMATDMMMINAAGDKRDTMSMNIADQEMVFEFTADSMCITTNKGGPVSDGKYWRHADTLEITANATHTTETMLILSSSSTDMALLMGGLDNPLIVTLKKK